MDATAVVRANPTWPMPDVDSRRTRPARHLTVVVFALTVGVMFGAIACAAGMAAAGHDAHAFAPPASGEIEIGIDDRDVISEVHLAHGTEDLRGERSTQRATSDITSDGAGGRSSVFADLGPSHPGMACVVAVDLTFPDLAVSGSPGALVAPHLDTRLGCVRAPEPPVPRFS